MRVALIGFGLAGEVFHAPLIEATPQMVLSGIVTKNPDRRRKAETRFAGAQLFSDVEELFSSAAKFDLVVIASPNRTHYEFAKRALESGLSVVVDKPMAPTFRECQELIELAERKKLLLSVFQNRRWDNDFLTVRQLIDGGRLGTVTRFESRFERWRPRIRPGHWREAGGPEECGGMLYDLGSHLIDQALVLFGKPTSVYGEIDARRQGSLVDDDCFVALGFEGGVHAHLWASAIACSGGPRYQIFAMNGTYRKYGLDPQEDALRAGAKPSEEGWGLEERKDWGVLFEDRNGLTSETLVQSLPGNYRAFYEQMRDAILQGAPVPVDPRESAEVVRIIELVRSGSQSRAELFTVH